MQIDQFLKLSIVFLLVVCAGCRTSPPKVTTTENPGQSDLHRVSPWQDYRGSASRYMDLLHTDLELQFDWKKREVMGTARLVMTPYFYPQDYVVLDAKGFDLQAVELISGEDESEVNYDYDQERIVIYLEEEVDRNETLVVQIRYIARPYENTVPEARGLYFINHDLRNPYQRRQIWTQGETDSNSRWFPTIDQPNERMTQRIRLTVSEKYRTLSNGALVATINNGNGTRTDTWQMDQPHAPYLTMISVNEHEVFEDGRKDLPINYWVDSTYAGTAKQIFGSTPEMLEFFSELLDYPYPWAKYDQIIVPEFVSGAMENTTASVFMDDVLLNESEILDQDWDDIIAHELFHQWFGDLVTCESWANLSLNEAFATYGEYLWFEEKYGDERAEYHAWISLQDYLGESRDESKQVIRYVYEHSDDMFDNHSYAKGGLILHMLRKYVGDEAFFQSLHRYLTDYAFESVEIHDLRRAFEKITGEDLTWFFTQWFMSPGHPLLEVSDHYQNDTLYIEVYQRQDLDSFPLFRLPLYIDVIQDDGIIRFAANIENENHRFRIPMVSRPQTAVVDGEYQLVGEIIHNKTYDQLKIQFTRGDVFRMRWEALQVLLGKFGPTLKDDRRFIEQIGRDSSVYVLEEMLLWMETMDPSFIQQHEKLVRDLVNHKSSAVRASAISVMGAGKLDLDWNSCLLDSSYYVRGATLSIMSERGIDIKEWATLWKHDRNLNVLLPIAHYFNQSGHADLAAWYVDMLDRIRSNDQFLFLQPIKEYALTASIAEQKILGDRLFLIALSHPDAMTRLNAFEGLILMSESVDFAEKIERIRSSEKDDFLQEIYMQY